MIGVHDFGGKLTSAMTAYPKEDPQICYMERRGDFHHALAARVPPPRPVSESAECLEVALWIRTDSPTRAWQQ